MAGVPAVKPPRLASLDIRRGLVMALMALDHARTYLTDAAYAPEDIAHTSLGLFITRWVTHFCAPAFFLLAGISVALMDGGAVPGQTTRRFLWTRGLWLIFLELTVVGFAWSFIPGDNFGGVIWSLGCAFLILSMLIQVKPRHAILLSMALILASGLLQRIEPESLGPAGWLWSLAYVPGNMTLPLLGQWFVLFPVLPWAAVMLLGYGIGPVFRRLPAERMRLLAAAGGIALLAFLVLRLGNLYGNPALEWVTGGSGEFSRQSTAWQTLVSLLDTEKYPPSLQYLLMTLGPILLLLAILTRWDGVASVAAGLRPLRLFGQVPLFFYILHLYALHLTALIAAHVSGQASAWLGWRGDVNARPAGYGYGLAGVYLG